MRDREIKEQLSIRLPINWVDRIYQIAEKERKSMKETEEYSWLRNEILGLISIQNNYIIAIVMMIIITT